MHHLRFGLMTLMLSLATLRFARGGAWMWAPLAMSGGLVVLLDLLGPQETSTLATPKPWILNFWLWATLPLVLAMNALLWWMAGHGDPLQVAATVQRLTGLDLLAARAASTPLHWLGALLGCGLITASAGTNVAHELTHRTRSPFDLIWGRWLLAFTFDTTFAIEHVHGHHARVATFEDPASARRGESVYAFILRSTFQQLGSAWDLEARRLARKGRPTLSLHNRWLRGQLFTLALLGLAYTLSGGRALAFFTLSGLFGKGVLEIVNYVEHYGLVRVPGTPVLPRHSWNSNAWMSSTMLYNLTRHSDHHAEGSKPFWRLRPMPEAPTLPTGYMGMILLTLVPPLFHKAMTPRLAAWDASYASDAERALVA
ncbi:MAG TPA: alkane 1-monooxygenase [Holophagaceae bacterium]|nr:alkane 1-monooxygenase [Holophagaceae bacterium]